MSPGPEIAPVAQKSVDEGVDEFGIGAGVTDEDPAHREETLASAGASLRPSARPTTSRFEGLIRMNCGGEATLRRPIRTRIRTRAREMGLKALVDDFGGEHKRH